MIWGARCRGGGRGAGLQGGQAAHLVNGKRRQLGRFYRNVVELHLRQRMKEEELYYWADGCNFVMQPANKSASIRIRISRAVDLEL